MNHSQLPDSLPLGKQTPGVDVYTPDLLCPISRDVTRQQLGLSASLPFTGVDVWNGYELSWLNGCGKPVVAVAQFQIPCDSPNIVESKSFKLYLNSFNQTRFEAASTVAELMKDDLSRVAGAPVQVSVSVLGQQGSALSPIAPLPGICLDGLDIEVRDYLPNPALLSIDESLPQRTEVLHSHLLRSSCPVTGQPDWGSVVISYTGAAITHADLLRYIISFRQHQEFHEQCAERMFMDILTLCRPQNLSVDCRYLRRGGLDINPFRCTGGGRPPSLRTVRQ